MARPVSTLEPTPAEKLQLERMARSKTGSQRDGLRARIILRRVEGAREEDVAKALGVSLTTVSTWSRRFELEGLDGLKDRPGRGRKAWLAADRVRKVLTQVVQPPRGKKKWSTRSMAAAAGMSHHSVHRIWKANDLKPHLLRTFKISNDPQFEQKFWDVIGLFLTRHSRNQTGLAMMTEWGWC
jgi:transposase